MKKVKQSLSVSQKEPPKPFPVVGIGASAGGLEAFMTLLSHLDANLGMAYVLIMHLSPTHKSALTEILQTKTKMPVHTVKDGMEVKADNIYVIPPSTFMSIVDGHLKLAPRSITSIGNFAVDYFLIALAEVYKNNAIGVILSGNANDGTLGLKAIKANGGIAFAQDDTAKFSGMPNNAIDSGNVDFILRPEGIAKELGRLVKTPYTILDPNKIEATHENEVKENAKELEKILSIVRNKSGIDFFIHYKRASIYRRIVRRMVLNKLNNLSDYRALLKKNSKEVDALYNDFLINVTSFFRDPDFYETLTKDIFPSIIKNKSVDPIRIWVAGCATGEEAYSIAICLIEFCKKNNLNIPIQIFASDLDANAVEKARIGIYTLSTLQRVSKSNIEQYFKKVDGHYQIVKSVREICIFSQQNLIKDPPFSRLDLISCQNVLIYLETTPQKQILQTFHYALKPSGFLFLGKSESIGTSDDLFESLDKKVKLYSRKSTTSPHLEFDIRSHGNGSSKKSQTVAQQADVDIGKEMNKLIMTRFVLPCVVLNQNLVIIQFFGESSAFLAPVIGKASLNVLKMIREDLVIDLRTLLQQAKNTGKSAIKESINIYNKKVRVNISLEVVPKKTSREIFYLVVFKERAVEPIRKGQSKDVSSKAEWARTIEKLEDELTQARELIRTTNEEYESTYEELQANNEEVLSSNEELQSVNEELETSKEELQSSNEELTTINEEMHKRNLELKNSQNYAQAVIETMHNPLLVLTANLQVRMANKAFYNTFQLTSDKTEGKFIFELGDNAWEISDLREQLNDLLGKKTNFKEFELKHSFPGLGELVLEVHAYRLSQDENVKETLILLAFNNISELAKSNKDLKKANERLEEFAFISSHDLQEPLRKIETFADRLASPEAKLNDYAKKYSEKISFSAVRMSTLVKDLLGFALLLRNDDRQVRKVKLNNILKNVIKDFEIIIQEKKAVVNVSSLPIIQVEPIKINQLFSNLIGNALKFGKDNPIINISSREVTQNDFSLHDALNKHTQYVAIIVSDNGIGFEQKYVEKMFTLFQRLNDKKGVEGSGMGLAICKKIVEDHGGLIIGEGKINDGATFTIFLPKE